MATADSEVKEDRSARTLRLVSDPEFMDKICAHVSNGGAATDYCVDRDVRYSDVMAWVNRSEDRRMMLAHAETARSQWFVQSILAELRNIGLVDIRQAYNASGGLKPIQDIPENVARCIVAVESEELFEGTGKDREQVGWVKKVKFSDKLRALELLGKNLQMFIDTSRIVLQGRVTLEDLVAASAAPAVIDVTPNKEVSGGKSPEVSGSEKKSIGDAGTREQDPGVGQSGSDGVGHAGVDIGPL